jgi:hypothetical protein
VTAKDGKLRQRAQSGCGIAFVDRRGISGAAGDDAVGIGGNDAGQIDELADGFGRQIVAAWRGKVGQGVACLGKKCFANGTLLCRTVSRSEGRVYDGLTHISSH